MKCFNHENETASGQCTKCGKALCKPCAIETPKGIRCRHCLAKGVDQQTIAEIKSPALALVLSLILIGAGQFYNGQVGKGILFLISGIVNFILVFLIIGLITGPIFYIWSIVDAYQTAKRINLEHSLKSTNL